VDVIENETQFMITARSWSKFNEVILRMLRSRVGKSEEFLLAECSLKGMESVRDELKQEMDDYDARIHPGRKGRWMPVFSGGRFWPEDPAPGDVTLDDIAHSLARINRFNGHTGICYSVAQHAVGVAAILPRRLQMFGLMHDAGECYLGDVITPVKRLLRHFYEPLEETVMRAVATRFGFLTQLHSDADRLLVKRADTVLLATEARDLTTAGFVNGVLDELPLPTHIEQCWDAEKAEGKFRQAFAIIQRNS
jgi:5'-deoxynucleotidase YfbR-like HD superfamily hydrolase